MRLCIAGKNSVAISVCDFVIHHYPYLSVFVLPTRNDSGRNGFQRSFLKYASDGGLRIVSLEDTQEWEDLVFISLEFDQIIKVDRFRSKALYNLHLSLLPKYKGMYTSAWPILNGEKETGVSLHRIDNGIDTGEIISQRAVPIDENDTCESLYLKLYRYGAEIVCDNIERLLTNTYSSFAQPVKGSSYYSKKTIDYSHLQIYLNQTACSIDRQIRAFHFRAYQLPVVYGYPIMHSSFTGERSTLPPGRILFESESELKISTIDYNLVLHKDRFDYLIKMAAEGDIQSLQDVTDIEFYSKEKDSIHGMNLLMVAGLKGHLNIVRFLLNKGFDPDDQDFEGRTSLFFGGFSAKQSGDFSVYDLLLEKGADKDIQDYSGKMVSEYLQFGFPAQSFLVF